MSPPAVKIQILHVCDCALLATARALVDRALVATGVAAATVECMPGDYPSPTVLINGMEVTGRRLTLGAACRLDLPTDDQLCAALVRAVQPVGAAALATLRTAATA